MRLAREDRFDELEPLLGKVTHPARYLDHEWGAMEDQPGPFHVCMIYADTYEVGQPNLGIAILYNELNRAEGISCERAYLPWVDMSALMRERGVPLLSLETSWASRSRTSWSRPTSSRPSTWQASPYARTSETRRTRW